MHALMVLPADIQDRDAAPFLLRTATTRMPTLQRAVADGGYQGGNSRCRGGRGRYTA